MEKEICPACQNVCHLTDHHVLPKRIFGGNGSSPKVRICRACHDELESKIRQMEIEILKGFQVNYMRIAAHHIMRV